MKTAELILIAAIGASLAGPAFAQAKPKAACSEGDIARVEASLAKMADGDNKTKAMQSTTAAKASLSQQDTAGCKRHLAEASKAMKARPGKK